MATLTRPETGEPLPTTAQIMLPAASTRLMMAKTSAGCALLGSFAARRARIPSVREKQAKPTYKSSSLNIGHIYTCSDTKVSSKCIWEKKLFRRIEICYNISVQTLVGAIIGEIEKHLKSHDLRCFSWQREKDSNIVSDKNPNIFNEIKGYFSIFEVYFSTFRESKKI